MKVPRLKVLTLSRPTIQTIRNKYKYKSIDAHSFLVSINALIRHIRWNHSRHQQRRYSYDRKLWACSGHLVRLFCMNAFVRTRSEHFTQRCIIYCSVLYCRLRSYKDKQARVGACCGGVTVYKSAAASIVDNLSRWYRFISRDRCILLHITLLSISTVYVFILSRAPLKILCAKCSRELQEVGAALRTCLKQTPFHCYPIPELPNLKHKEYWVELACHTCFRFTGHDAAE